MPIHRLTELAPAVGSSLLTPELVVQALEPLLSPARRRRIGRVLDERLLSVTVVLEHPYDPHNAAAVLRTCEGLGLVAAHVIPGPTGFRLSARVTQSADKWLDVYLHRDTAACLAYLRRAGFMLCGALPPELGSCAAESAPLGRRVTHPLALVFGNEHAGLTAEGIRGCDGRFHLPMYGFTESYNLSVSVALALAGLVEARRAALGGGGDLSAEHKLRLRAAYYARAVERAPEHILRLLGQPHAP